jgi:hypothetical protein
MEEILFPIGWFLLIGLGLAGGLGSLYYYGQQKKKAKDKAWWQFAQMNQLTFVEGQGRGSHPSVTGNYKGYTIKLETVEKLENKSTIPYSCFRLMAKTEPKVDHLPTHFPPGQTLSVEQVEELLPLDSSIYFGADLTIQNKGLYWSYEERGYITDVTYIHALFDQLIELAQRYPQVLLLGGDAVKALHKITSLKSPLRPVTRQLLKDIAAETSGQFKENFRNRFCPHCLTYYNKHTIWLFWWQSITYYGCRTCRQSRLVLKGPLIAVLDNRDETVGLIEGHKVWRVNWTRRRALFDFSGVAILQATDEEVERFAVQIGNDTDKYRKPRYAKMTCSVSAQCQLSENTMRILERMFGEVRVEAL